MIIVVLLSLLVTLTISLTCTYIDLFAYYSQLQAASGLGSLAFGGTSAALQALRLVRHEM